MSFKAKLCFFLLFTLTIVSSACKAISISSDEILIATKERSLVANIEDYSEPTANRGHDPTSRARGGGGNGRGRGHSRGRKG
ncbi:protein PSY3-like [Gossypium arboreum]|uniref:protein PSY3-like n=1 Tax=Gossypium arboreum TaxID=29729 RepID=UPI0008196F21|nr:protein PSY3-like [Gossypium arboreum]